jgi:CBS domain containing-hemolysin-like protein
MMSFLTNFALILAAFGFVILNGFFVVAEFSLVKIRQTQVESLSPTHGLKGRILSKVHSNLDAYLSACQLGITLSSLGLGWIGEPAFAELLTPLLESFGLFSQRIIHLISFILAFSIISYLHIVIGELMPKSMAIRQPIKMSLFSAAPLYAFYWLMYPLIALLNASSNKILEWMRLGQVAHHDHLVSVAELKGILTASHHHGELSHKEIKTLNHLLELYDLQVSDVMRPVGDLVFIDVSKPLMQEMRLLVKTKFSRYPVCEGSTDNVLGVIHIKDLLPGLVLHNRSIDWKEFIRPILRVQVTDNALDLLEQFRRGASHLALVYSEEMLVGFLSFDNLLQIITGKIRDEFHFSAEDVFDLPEGAFLLRGGASIYTLERLLGCDLSDYPVSTVMGLILHKAKELPSDGVIVEFDKFSLGIEKMEDPKHVWIKVIIK